MSSCCRAREPRLAVRGGLGSCALLGAALLPKCPLCVAAYLVGLGMSASVASWAAPLFTPLLVGLSAAGVLALCVGTLHKLATSRH